MAHAGRVRGRDRRVQPVARAGVDPARDLLRRGASPDRPARSSAASRSSFPGSCSSSASPHCSSRLRRHAGCSAPPPAPARPSPRSRSVPAPTSIRPSLARTPTHAGDGTLYASARWQPRPRPSDRGSCSSWSACGLAEVAPAVGRTAELRDAALAARRRHRGATGGLLAARLGRVQGRRPLLRRRLRHHPAHAGRRRRPLPLDDQRAVPRRRRARSDHPGARSCRPSPSSAISRTAPRPSTSPGDAPRRGARHPHEG